MHTITIDCRPDVETFVQALQDWNEVRATETALDFLRTALSTIFHDAAFEAGNLKPDSSVYLRVACHSHWKRPHQVRWTMDGGFAYPQTYTHFANSLLDSADTDWTAFFEWEPAEQTWRLVPVREVPPKGAPFLGVMLPSRTARHAQAAIYTRWSPPLPGSGPETYFRIYGFRNLKDQWQLTACEDYPRERRHEI